MDSNKVNVIAEIAELAEDIDLERAKAALAKAQAAADEEDRLHAQAGRDADHRRRCRQDPLLAPPNPL